MTMPTPKVEGCGGCLANVLAAVLAGVALAVLLWFAAVALFAT